MSLTELGSRQTSEMATPAGVARAFFERLDVHDVDGALELVDPNADVHLIPAGVRGGRTACAEFLHGLVEAFPDLRVVVRNLFTATDGIAVAEVTVEGTQAADFRGIINQEKHFDVDQGWLLRVTDGRVRSLRAYWCQNQLYRRLAVKRIDHVTITA